MTADERCSCFRGYQRPFADFHLESRIGRTRLCRRVHYRESRGLGNHAVAAISSQRSPTMSSGSLFGIRPNLLGRCCAVRECQQFSCRGLVANGNYFAKAKRFLVAEFVRIHSNFYSSEFSRIQLRSKVSAIGHSATKIASDNLRFEIRHLRSGTCQDLKRAPLRLHPDIDARIA